MRVKRVGLVMSKSLLWEIGSGLAGFLHRRSGRVVGGRRDRSAWRFFLLGFCLYRFTGAGADLGALFGYPRVGGVPD